MNYLKTTVLFLLEVILFIIAYFTGVYKSVFFTSLFSSITSLPVFSIIRSFLILICMSVPLLIVLHFINNRFIKLDKKIVFYVHGIFVVVCLLILELIVRVI